MYDEPQAPTAGQKVAKTLRGVAHTLAAIPVVGWFGGWILGPGLSALAGAVESVDGFINRGFSSGVKSLVSGVVDTVATATVSANWWLFPVNWITGLVAPGFDTIPELARKGTQGILDSALPDKPISAQYTDYARQNRVIGMNPRIIGSRPAAVGYSSMYAPEKAIYNDHMRPEHSNPMMAPHNYWTDTVAQQRGQDPETMRRNWMRDDGNRQHVEELMASREQQAALESQRG